MTPNVPNSQRPRTDGNGRRAGMADGRTLSDHAPTAGQAAQGDGLEHAAKLFADSSFAKPQEDSGKPPESAGFLVTLLCPTSHRGEQRMSRRNVGEIIKR